MDHGYKNKMQNYKIYRKRKTGKNVQCVGPGKQFSNLTPKVWSIKGKSDKLNVKN